MENEQAMRELGDSLAGDWRLASGVPRGETRGIFTGAEAVVLASFQIGIRLFDTRSREYRFSCYYTRRGWGLTYLLLLS
jgi:hypothetical protein